MNPKQVKINLEYLRPNNSFIYPIYSSEGEKILESRVVLTADMIKKIILKHGSVVYYTDTGDRAVIPSFRMKIAYNQSLEMMEEIVRTEKLSRASYKVAEKVIEEILKDLSSAEVEVISLLKELHSFDEYLYNHSVNVGILTAIFSKKMGAFTPDEVRSVTLGAYLHDIGEKKIDKQLLNKKDKLDVSELQKIKRHPQIGYEIIKAVDKSNPIVHQAVLFHHEKFNNRGYYQLPYENLPMFPKIVSLCDIYDALTSERPFRAAWPPSQALKSIVNSIDVHHDRALIHGFINIMAPLLNNTQSFYATGEICALNTQELALISEFSPRDLMKPRVRIFCKFLNAKGKLAVQFYSRHFDVNLEEDRTRHITKILNNNQQVEAIRVKLRERGMI